MMEARGGKMSGSKSSATIIVEPVINKHHLYSYPIIILVLSRELSK